MGRIKSLMIKKASWQLLKADSGRFNTSFDDNKKALGHKDLPSKSTRNKIVGYIARIKKMEKEAVLKEAKRKEKEIVASEELPQYEQY